MTLLAKYTLRFIGKQAAERFEKATRDVRGSQEAKLREILSRNARTEYGRRHSFGSIRSLEEYRSAVPITDYEGLRDSIDRMARGERNVLTAEDPLMFAQTSGTSGSPKLIPITPTCQGRDQRDQMRTWLYHAQKDHPDVLRGKVLSLVSPAVEGHTEAGIPFGSTSGFIYKGMPKPVQATYLVPYGVFELEDYETKYYLLMRLGLKGGVTFLSTANPSSIAKLCETVESRADELIRGVRDGDLGTDLDLPKETRSELQRSWSPDPDRARELERMRGRRDGKLLPGDFWPDLELIGCWKGGTVGAYLQSFPQWFDPDGKGDLAVRDWGYLSSEARGSIPLSDEGSGGVLTVGTNVVEFIETTDLEAHPDEPDRWTVLGAHEVEAPREYYVFFTTTGGLYRYDINDVVRIEGFYNDAPTLTFQRKGRGMTNITGEKVSVNQVIEAVTKASEATHVEVSHFKAVADSGEARYQFYVECPDGASDEQCGRLLAAIEDQLRDQNLEYAGKRDSQRLGAPRLALMKPGWYDTVKQRQGKRLFQSKTILLEPREGEEDDAEEKAMLVREVEI